MPRFLAVVSLLLLTLPVRAQSGAKDISDYLNSSIARLAEHTEDFNSHVSAINLVRPFDGPNLDSSRIESTISSVLQFTQYLRAYIRTTDSLRTALTDSLDEFRRNDPNPDLQRSINRFEKSYKTDQSAWRDYLEALQEVYDNVLSTLLFVKSTKHDVQSGQLRFANAADLERNSEYMMKIGRLTTTLMRARNASQKATEAANKQLQALNAIHTQQPKHTIRKKK